MLNVAQLVNRWEKAGFVHPSDRIGSQQQEGIQVSEVAKSFIIAVRIELISASSAIATASVARADTVSVSLSFLES